MYKPDHYRTNQPNSPLPKKVYTFLKIFFVLFFIFLNLGSKQSSRAVSPAAKLTIIDDTLRKDILTNITLKKRESLFLLFPDMVLYLDNLLQTRCFKKFRTNTLFSANEAGFVTYKKVGKKITLFDNSGTKRYTIKTPAYPRMVRTGKHIFLYTGDQSGISFVNKAGQKSKKQLHFPSLISGHAYAPKNNAAYLGFLDGTLEKINISTMSSSWRKKIDSSKLQFIKGVALSQDEKALAVLSGSGPERFSLLSANGELQWSIQTEGDRRTEARIFVGEQFCFGHTDNFVYLLSRGNGSKLFAAPSRGGTIRWADFSDHKKSGLAAFSYSAGDTTTIILLDRQQQILMQKVIKTKYAFVRILKEGQLLAVQTDKGILFYLLSGANHE